MSRRGLLVLLLVVAAWASGDQSVQSVQSVEEEVSFAMRELCNLSDSGVYKTLSVAEVVSSRQEDGIFHYNTILELRLASPHFASKQTSEAFEVIVMTHKEDGVKSIAIDEFPVMSEAAIETFYAAKVEEKTRQREESFRRLEIEAILNARAGVESTLDDKALRIKEQVESSSVVSLLDALDTPALKEGRRAASLLVQPQLQGTTYLLEEAALLALSLGELYDVSMGLREASSFQKTRAVDMIDAVISSL